MSKLVITDLSKFYLSLNDIKEDGFSPVKVNSLVQYYKLEGKKTIINKANLVPIEFIQYVYFSPAEVRFYLKAFPNYSCNDLFFYKKLTKFDENIRIEQLRERVNSGHGVWLLFDKAKIADMSAMLKRVWTANRSDEGKLNYKDWIFLAELHLRRNDYAEYYKEGTGFRTTLKQMDDTIMKLWKEAIPTK